MVANSVLICHKCHKAIMIGNNYRGKLLCPTCYSNARSDGMDVTKNLFDRYVQIRDSGRYNMVMDRSIVIKMLGTTSELYSKLQNNFEYYWKEFH